MGNRAGDNNQLLSLVQELDWPFEEKQIRYNALRRVPPLRRGLTIVARRSRGLIQPPWPDLVIGTGYGSVPVARRIRQLSGGRAKLVHIGNPRDELADFDLQITTPQYARGKRPNLLELPLAIGNPAMITTPDFAELRWLRAFRKPRRLLAVGGPARHWELDQRALFEAVETLRDKADGSILAATSHRTPHRVRRRLRAFMRAPNETTVHEFPRFATLLGESDEIYVTADSVSMISQAILTGKPVGIIPIKRSRGGKLATLLYERPIGHAAFPNLRNFWTVLERERLVGSVNLPVASQVCDTVGRAAEAVRSVMAQGDAVDEGKT